VTGGVSILILSRKIGQSLVIGDSIEITVVAVRDGQVRLGISAPRDVTVYRKEIMAEIAAENLEAADSARTVEVSGHATVVHPVAADPQAKPDNQTRPADA
jgi:carbon storage regulator